MFEGLLGLMTFLSVMTAGDGVAGPEGPEAPPSGTELSEMPDNGGSKFADGFGVLPVPVVLTEPAIGKGLGVALALIHPAKRGKAEAPRLGTVRSVADLPRTREAPLVVTAMGGAYTSNDSWFAGVGHVNNWLSDSIRYSGAVGSAGVNSQVYLLGIPLNFAVDGSGTLQELRFRLGRSNFLAGVGASWIDADAGFGFDTPGAPADPGLARQIKDAGVALSLLYDTRNNGTRSTSGQLGEIKVWRHDRQLSGNFDYWSWLSRFLVFHPLGARTTLGVRAEISGVDGSVPFFAYPYIKLRGIPALRYQDRVVGIVETEVRYLLADRWEVSVFGGAGHVSDQAALFRNPDEIYNFGTGFRYKVFGSRDIWMGLDVARGPEEWNFYIQVGHAW